MPPGTAGFNMGLRSQCMLGLSFDSFALTKYPEFLKVRVGKNSDLKVSNKTKGGYRKIPPLRQKLEFNTPSEDKDGACLKIMFKHLRSSTEPWETEHVLPRQHNIETG